MEDRKELPELELPEGYCLGPVLSARAPQDERDVPMGIKRKVEGRLDNTLQGSRSQPGMLIGVGPGLRGNSREV